MSAYRTSINAIRAFIKPGLLPYSMALVLLLFAISYQALNLPSPNDIAQFLNKLIDSEGIFIFIFIAFVEALFVLSIYFPGSLVIVFTVIHMDASLVELISILALCVIGFVFANVVNYYIGRLGFHRVLRSWGGDESLKTTTEWIKRRGNAAIIGAGVHPNVMAACVVCLGIAGMPFHKAILLSTASLLGWSAVYLPILAALSESRPSGPGHQILVLGLLFMSWGLTLSVLDLRRSRMSRRKSPHSS